MPADFICYLFDNGSFRADSTRSLRGLAARLSQRLSHEVCAVSLLHSTRVKAEELDGVPAQLLEPALDEWFGRNPSGRALLLPLFFGPSGALVDYVPERLASLGKKYPHARAILAEALVLPDEEPHELVAILADRVRAVVQERAWVKPCVVLCDHGTPLKSVTEVRDRLAAKLSDVLRGEVAEVAPASMERREGDEYAFNEPLLATRLATPPFDQGNVVVALQFLSPGRHAGPGGDVAEICRAAEEARPGLCTAMSAPIADDPRLVEVLARRAETALARLLA
ncbi:MAG: cobalamin biosynthesis protein CbiX [Opitutaceae bacterium]|nr:cobalamin biosynthesis protein CbiX [Opitutaceae bacterium]